MLEHVSTLEECIRLVEHNKEKLSLIHIIKERQIVEKKYKDIVDDLDLKIITIFDDEYTENREIKNKKPVIFLFERDIIALPQPNIVILGTRELSEWSMKVEKRLIQKLMELADRIILKGFALRREKIAHEITVSAGR